jgi:hypothetical protein
MTNFTYNEIGELTPISYEIFQSMKNNDNVVKSFAESTAKGVVFSSKQSSSITIPQIDQALVDSTGGSDAQILDPDWSIIQYVFINIEDFKMLRFSLTFPSITHQATPTLNNVTPGFKHAANIRVRIIYSNGEDELVPVRFVAAGGYILAQTAYEFDGMMGSQVCLSMESLASLGKTSSDVKNFSIIKPGNVRMLLEVRKLDAVQVINASAEANLIFTIEDLGAIV